ncbi:MAG: response regulator [Desulfamplus sp.]|nr:response regulator [Desulfamplus sp.]
MNVLVVDDDSAVLKVSAKRITNYGHKVVTAENGQAARDLFFKTPSSFDMILSDVMMPVMDGLELLKEIRQRNIEIPFVILTAFGDIHMVTKALKLGATDFLSKPCEKKELLGVLNRIGSMTNTKQNMDYTLPFLGATTFQTSMPSRTDLIPGIIGLLQSIAKPYCNLYGINIAEISTPLSEALTNAVVHGSLEVPSSIKYRSWEEFQNIVQQRESMPEYGGQPVYISFNTFSMDGKIEQKEEIRSPFFGSADMKRDVQDREDTANNSNIQGLEDTANNRSIQGLEDVVNNGNISEDAGIRNGVINKRKSGKGNLAMQWDVADTGKGFDINNLPDRHDPEKYLLSGRGIFLIRSFMDKISWSNNGSCIHMVKYLRDK